ncbi:hypothetical protein UFOVP653_2 [uncultured Caudovirales phage]|uniref:Uncharacterized protein n=1 Tax=uncultured Caudovirales phage TaxID=2100421 RepID=A0A6J5N6U0_9CAUD|nr:hypothetical protein UFOVP653_2 [uncultured Caudovirales phage]
MSAAITGAIAATVVGSALSDDNGAEGANNAAADSTRLQSEIARDQWNRYKTMYSPLEESYVKEAQNYDSPENYARAAGDASATVSSQFAKAREQLMRTPGLDPSSGAFQAGMTNLGLSEAANSAVQQNAARNKVKDMAFARKTDALSLGKGLPAQAATMLGSAATTNLGLANAGMAQANAQAGAFGRVADRIFTPKNLQGVSNWLGGGTQAGSMNGNGSVQGNTDFVYDL